VHSKFDGGARVARGHCADQGRLARRARGVAVFTMAAGLAAIGIGSGVGRSKAYCGAEAVQPRAINPRS
jgi:hypothetical protein